MLEVSGVVKDFPAVSEEPPVRAVDDVSLAASPGELVALTGPSGSGKSTLLQIIATILRPDRGNVRVDGRDVSSLSERDASRFRLKELGFIMQAPRLVRGLSAIDSAVLKLLFDGVDRREAQRSVTPLMDRLDLSARADHRARELSIGERQRVAIVQALAGQPRLVLADEPTASLDPARAATAIDLFKEHAQEHGAAIVVVTHDPDVVRAAGRELTLSRGHLADETQPTARAAGLPQ
jgi:putative ABC transport system ATP-binding protein